jgi:carboxymethylenebutenolidase
VARGSRRNHYASLVTETRTERIAAHDGGSFDGFVWLPSESNGSAILLLHEIFGVARYIRDVAARTADLGFVVLVPDLFWRIEPGVALGGGQADVEQGMSYASRFDWERGLDDCGAALEHLRSLPEVSERTGELGLCFGGSLAFLCAASAKPDFAVCYYGSAVPDALDRLDDIDCPLLLHFGGSDPFISRDRVARVEKAVAGRTDVEINVEEDAGHAFDNHESELFHHPNAARRSWSLTVDFLGRMAQLPSGN